MEPDARQIIAGDSELKEAAERLDELFSNADPEELQRLLEAGDITPEELAAALGSDVPELEGLGTLLEHRAHELEREHPGLLGEIQSDQP